MVPNVPCGVESPVGKKGEPSSHFVPNVPCGVESYDLYCLFLGRVGFLMYRVELKEKVLEIRQAVALGS